ncbi:hypothetical protein MBOL_23100 [Mycobacteroides abscessus subsp. bolletii BD]|nr:hypothetical protein MBOL_23100 [Mycobacteroides abscessus subsp. bolletii BD]
MVAAGAGPVGSYPGGGGPFSEWYPGGNGGPDGSGAAYGSRIRPGFEDSGAFVEMYPGGSCGAGPALAGRPATPSGVSSGPSWA